MFGEGIRQETGLVHRKDEPKGWGMGHEISFMPLLGMS